MVNDEVRPELPKKLYDRIEEDVVKLHIELELSIPVRPSVLVSHVNDFKGCKFTPKGMLQIKTNQVIDFERLKIVFSEALV